MSSAFYSVLCGRWSLNLVGVEKRHCLLSSKVINVLNSNGLICWETIHNILCFSFFIFCAKDTTSGDFESKLLWNLSSKSYKLDQYLGWVLEIANSKLAVDAAGDGRRYFGEFRGLCKAILDYEPEVKNHEFYQTAKRFIESYRYSSYIRKNTLC